MMTSQVMSRDNDIDCVWFLYNTVDSMPLPLTRYRHVQYNCCVKLETVAESMPHLSQTATNIEFQIAGIIKYTAIELQ